MDNCYKPVKLRFLWLIATVCLSCTAAIADDTRLSRADARHLLSRTGLGVDHHKLLFFTGKNRHEAIDYIIEGFSDKPALPMPAWTAIPAPLYWTRKDLTTDEQQAFDRRREFELVELRQWWVDNMLATESPQTERMVLFWHDHFATSYYGINRQSKALAIQNQTFRELAIGNFRTLLKQMIRDPALLNYLDNLSNRKGSPNENFARELLEVLTLGEGNYDQFTVAEAARSLTGHGVSQNRDLSFEFKSWNYDTNNKTLFGQTGKYDADDLIDIILQQPSTADFIARKFWSAFISDQPPDHEQIKPLSDKFRKSNYDLERLYRATLESEAFWHPVYRATLIKSPAQLFIGAARSLKFPRRNANTIPALMERSGMNLFAPPNIAGWAEGMAWITPGRLLNRRASLKDLVLHTSNNPPDPSQNNMQSQNIMSANMGMSAMQPSAVENRGLQLHIAAENYRGAAKYQIELLADDKKLLWQTNATDISKGHETTQFGRIKNVSDLPWEVVSVDAHDALLEKAGYVRIRFVNDDAGNDGDRNLFVSGASLNNHWYDSSQGTQKSKCTPQTKANAGNLYCNGYIDINISRDHTTPTSAKSAAASVHVNWVRATDQQLDLTLALQDFYYADMYFPTFTFHLQSKDAETPRLELSSLGCWPDCPIQWPVCAWQDPLDNSRKTLAFYIDGPGESDSLRCHHQSVKGAVQQLISSLFISADDLTRIAAGTPRHFAEDQRNAIEHWQHLLAAHKQLIQHHHGYAPAVSINSALKRKYPIPRTPHRFTGTVSSVMEFDREIARQDLTLSELLLPGIPVESLPELNHLRSTSAETQLHTIISHPVFQLQ